MRRSIGRISSLAALALSGAALAAPTRSEATAFCQAVASTASKGENEINTGSFTCNADASTLNIATFPGSGGAATQVTPGVLRTRTNAMSSDNRGEGSFVLTQAIVDYRDTITVGGLGADGALLNFKVGIDGLLAATGPSTAGSSFRFTGSLGNRSRIGPPGKVFQACVHDVPGVSCNPDFDVAANGHGVVNALVTLSVFAFNGDVIDLVLGQTSSSLTIVSTPDGAGSTEALFLHTTDWRGLDFTDANRDVTLTSLSGFDYRFAALPQGVPEPATWAMMILGFGAVGTAIRSRRRTLATA